MDLVWALTNRQATLASSHGAGILDRSCMTVIRFATCALVLSLAGCAQRAPVSPRASTVEEAGDAQRQTWLQMFARGYFPGRSGQIFFVPHEGEFVVDTDPLYGYMHGSPWPYDSHIPLLFHGQGVVAGVYDEPVVQQDVAPTLAALLAIAPPPTVTGRPLRQALIPSARAPRIVALFVLDGMRADYFETYASDMPTLSRLRREGAWFSNMRTNSIPTATSIGHATLGTGADPRVHGLVANQLFNRVTGRSQEAYAGLDPAELMALTLADVWNLATDGRAIIIGQGGAIRATAGLVGRGACMINGRKVLAASYSTRDAGWETNDRCYELPAALATLNGAKYWQDANGTWRGHDIASARTLRPSAVFQRFEGDALAAVLESQSLGEDSITDLVFVNIKSPDYVAHAYGPASSEMKETLAELDRQLTRALTILERQAGRNQLAVAITADHGMPGDPPTGRRRIQIDDLAAALDKEFASGGTSVVSYFGDPANAQIYLNEARLRELGVPLDTVARFLEQHYFAAAFTEADVRRAQAQLPLGQ
jgi:hypothetical protein